MITTIDIEPNILKKLEIIAINSGQTKEYCLNRILEQGIEETEDYYSAHEILKQIKNGNEKTFYLEEIRKELELDN